MRKLLAFALLFALRACVYGQVTVVPVPLPRFQATDGSGRPLAFGCVDTWASGTTSPIDSYTDSTGTTKNQNPVILSANGSASIWLLAGQNYTLRVKSSGGTHCSAGSTIYTVNGLGGGASTLTTVVPFSSTPTFTDISQNQLFTITLTANAAALPLSVVGVIPPGLITFQITQDSSGGHTFAWPSNVVGGAPIGLNANQVTTQEFVWNGTNATAVGSGITGNGPNISVGNISASNLTATGSVTSSNQGTEVSIANEGTTGTLINTLTTLTGTPSTAILASTSTTSGIIGVTVSGAGTTSSAVIQTTGIVSCIFDGTTTAGDYVQASITTAGNCSDAGTTPPIGTQTIGQVLSTIGAPGTANVFLFSPGTQPGSRVICTNISPVQVTSNTLTSLQPLQTCKIPTGSLNADGKTIRITSIVQTNPASTYTTTAWLASGTTTTLAVSSTSIASSATSSAWSTTFILTCTVIVPGAAGELSCTNAGMTTGSVAASQSPVLTGVDFTGTLYIGTGITFSTGNVSNSSTGGIMLVEQLN